MLLCRLGVDEELTDSENEEEEQQRGPSNQALDEGIEPPSDGMSTSGKGDDSEPCCSSSVVDSISNRSSGDTEPGSASSGPKVDTVISTDDKELPPHDQDDQSNQDYEVWRSLEDISRSFIPVRA